LCDRFEAAWKAGGRPRLEDYLAGTPDGERAAVAWDLLRVETHYRRQAGEQPRLADYQDRLPLLTADEIALALQPSPVGSTRPEAPPGSGEPAGSGEPDVSAPPGYELLGQLGRGGMGVVYKARDTRLGRPVALKFLRPGYTRDPEALWRFRREAQTASALNDPHICTVYALDEHRGQPYLALEFIDGQMLRALVGQARPLAGLLPLVGQVAQALAVAHAAGIVHRDIKPENLVVRPDGLVKVLDFGLARLLPAGAVKAPAQSGRATDPGTVIGTLRYMAPEQARGEAVDAAADIFALGLVLYELLTGQHPFPADSEHAVLQAIIMDTPVPPARLNPEVPPGLEALIQKMLDKDPRRRPNAAEVAAALAKVPEATVSRSERRSRRPTVGREQERAALQAGFESAAGGRGSLLCVTGEPGLGKTTLVEEFLDELAATGRAHQLARGRCSERLAGAEAYLPVLEALDSLLRGPDGALAASVMRREAPTWYVQLAPAAGADPSLAALRAEVEGASQERLKRELGVFLGELSRLRPLVLFLDDVHWADASTVDLLAWLGGRCAGLRLLVLLTYRPSELALGRHPFGPVQLDLQGRGVCREVPLTLLGPAEVERYLALRFPGHDFPPELAAFLHRHTEGNPLFLVDLLGYLCDQGMIVATAGRWGLARPVPELPRELPGSIRGLIQRKLDRLEESDRRLLVAASVQGQQFDAAVVARALERDAAEVEERLAVLDRVHALVRCLGEYDLPDRTPTVRYGFVHVLYQNALYGSLQPTRKAAWSAAVARVLLSCHGEQSPAVAAELALLFEAARDWSRAAEYCLVAAQNAARVFATHEAAGLARRGLESLRKLPDTPARARRELQLQITLGVQMQASGSFGALEAEQAFSRARVLCKEVSEGQEVFPVLWGLWMHYASRAESGVTAELTEQLRALAHGASDPALLVPAHLALLEDHCVKRGDFAAARTHLEQGLALYDPQQHGGYVSRHGYDLGVLLLGWGAWALHFLGYPEQALESTRRSVALARAQGHPHSLAFALADASFVYLLHGELTAARAHAEENVTLSTEQEIPSHLAAAHLLRGAVLAAQGCGAQSIAPLREGWAAWLATGAVVTSTWALTALAEALGRAGQAEEGLAAVAEGLALAQSKGELYYEAELHRLQGELLLLQSKAQAAGQVEAEACFRSAIAISQRQQAKCWELRAAMSLVRLYRQQGRPAEARPLLAQTHGWFTEGFDTLDLREAKALLKELV
jgi:predicted ATPase